MEDIKTFFIMLKQIFSLMSSRQKRNAVLVLITIIISSFFETLGVAAMLPFVQALTAPEQLMQQKYIAFLANVFKITETKQLVILIGIGIILFYLLKNAFVLFSAYVKNKFSVRLTKDMSIQLMNSFMNRPYSYFTAHNSGEILRGVNGDVYSVSGALTNFMLILSEGMVVLVIAIYLFIEDPFMALGVVIVGLIVALFVVIILKKHLSAMGQLSRQADGEGNKVSVQISQGIKDIFVMRKRDVFLEKFIATREKTRKATLALAVSNSIPERLIETFCISGIIGVVLLRFAIGADMTIFVATLAVFAMAAFRILPSISRISGYLSGMIYYRPGLDAAFKNISEANEYVKSLKIAHNDEINFNDAEFKEKIFVDNISWKYENIQKNVLENLSLTVHRGESVGIIGESGAGKSTLSDILLGLYMPQKGTVTVDGQNIFSVPKTWSRLMGYVPQSVFLMDDTIRANVAFGEDDIDDEKIWMALEKASLKKFVSGLENGLDTVVGERGVKFSGGQRQRIAIARALYRNPQILILDEATSALDNDTENSVMEAIESLQGTMTMIIIAHRLTTIRNCDHIYEIKDGKAVERRKEDIFS